MRFFVGFTGASGHVYGQALVRALVDAGHDVDVSVTSAGSKVMRHELGIDPGPAGSDWSNALAELAGEERLGSVRGFQSDAVEAPPSSGTSLTGGVILCPCSMGTLGRVSAGFSSNLVERAADVALKENRTLVLVPRESPMSAIHLENLLRLANLGAAILPAAPGFYHRPKSIEDLVNHLVGKILDRLGVEHGTGVRWKGLPEDSKDPGVGGGAAG